MAGQDAASIPRMAKRKSQQAEPIPMFSWAGLAALAGVGLGMWMPIIDHQKRQILGWAIIVAVVAWVAKFGRSTAGLIAAFFVAVIVLFGGPLHTAAQLGAGRALAKGIQMGLDMNARNLLGGASPLHVAATAGKVDSVQLLLESGADAKVAMESGLTPLHEAAWEGHGEIAMLLLSYGAEIDATDSFGQTALHRAAWRGTILLVKILIDNGAKRDIKDKEGVVAMDLSPYEEVRDMLR